MKINRFGFRAAVLQSALLLLASPLVRAQNAANSECVSRTEYEEIKRELLALKNELDAIKKEPKLKDMALVKLSRLSVGPVTADEWKLICKMGGMK